MREHTVQVQVAEVKNGIEGIADGLHGGRKMPQKVPQLHQTPASASLAPGCQGMHQRQGLCMLRLNLPAPLLRCGQLCVPERMCYT